MHAYSAPQTSMTAATIPLPGFTPVPLHEPVTSSTGHITEDYHDDERSLMDPTGRHIEASRADLSVMAPQTLHDWVAALEGAHLSQILLIAEKNGHPVEAIYGVDPPNNTFAPTTARLMSGDPSIFPPQGMIRYGDDVLAPDTSEIQVLPQPAHRVSTTPENSSAQYPHVTAFAAVSDTISKTQRSAKNGTRVLKDEVIFFLNKPN